MSVFKIFQKFLSSFIGVFTKYSHGAFVLSSGEHFEVHVVLLEETMEIRKLGNHTDRAQDGKGRSNDPVCDAGHHVASTGRHLVNAGGEAKTLAANPVQLGGRKAIGMNQPTTAFEADNHFVFFRIGNTQHRSNCPAKRICVAGFDIAVEIQNIDATTTVILLIGILRGLGRFLLRLLSLFPGLLEHLSLVIRHQP